MARPSSPTPIENLSKTLRHSAAAGVTFGDVVYGPAGSCGPRVQADYQIVVLVEGEARVRVETTELRVGAGEAALFRPGREEHFRFTAGQRTHHTWCAVEPRLVTRELAAECARAPAVQPLSARLSALLEMGLALPTRAVREAPALVQSLGLAALAEYALAGRVAAAAAGGGDENDAPDALHRALDWIGQHYAEETDAARLARAAGVSPAQLTKLFRRHLDTTPMRALWEARTRAGLRQLRETGLTVGEIAYRCGFQTPFHFSRWVRALGGASPREFRQRAWAAQKGG